MLGADTGGIPVLGVRLCLWIGILGVGWYRCVDGFVFGASRWCCCGCSVPGGW